MATRISESFTLQRLGAVFMLGTCLLVGALFGLGHNNWVAALLSAGGALVISLLWPKWGMYLLLWVLFASILPPGTGKFLGGVVMVGWLANQLLVTRAQIQLGALGPWLIGLFALALVSGLAHGQLDTQVSLLMVTGLILYFLIVNMVDNTADFEALMLNVVLIATAASLLVIQRTLAQGLLRPGALSQGALGDPNDTALFINIALPFVVLASVRAWRWRWVARLLLPVLMGGILLTLSRGGFIVSVAGFVILFGATRVIRRFELFLILTLFLALQLVPIISNNFNALLFRFSREDISALGSAETRVNTIRVGIRLGLNNPWLGAGPNRFSAEIVDYRTNEYGTIALAPHNTYLQAFAELGAPGLLTLIGMLISNVVRLYRIWRHPTPVPITSWLWAMVAMVLSYYLSIFFLNHLYARDIYLVLALVEAFANLHTRQVAAAEKAYGTVTAPLTLPDGATVPAGAI